jgi:hypothetical protein
VPLVAHLRSAVRGEPRPRGRVVLSRRRPASVHALARFEDPSRAALWRVSGAPPSA